MHISHCKFDKYTTEFASTLSLNFNVYSKNLEQRTQTRDGKTIVMHIFQNFTSKGGKKGGADPRGPPLLTKTGSLGGVNVPSECIL